MFLESLKKIVPPPANPVEPGQGQSITEQIGTPLPEDYRDYISSYGTGSFNDFIIPYNPFAAKKHLNLLKLIADHQTAIQVKYLNFPDDSTSTVAPFVVFPEENGLLPCGTITNFGDYFFWQVKGHPPEWRIVLYNLRDGEYEMFDVGFTDWLGGILSKKTRTKLLPEDFLDEDVQIVFQPTSTV